MKLGKTKDSRTRKQATNPVDITEVEKLQNELQQQKDFVNYLLAKGYSTTTVERYVRDTQQFIAWAQQENVPIENVRYNDILYYIQNKRNKVKQRTISTNVNSIKHYFNYLGITHEIVENPTAHIQLKGIKRKILYHIVSKQELESLYHKYEIPDEKTDKNKNQNWFKTALLTHKRNKVILGFMIYQGLGTTELSRLTIQDVKLREGTIYIAGTRRSNERTLKLEAHQIMDIMEYTQQTRLALLRTKTSDLFFVSEGTQMHMGNMMITLLKQLRAQNSKVTSTKQIRTSVITHWLKNNNLRQTQYMAGHRYVSSTEAYVINDLDDLLEDVSKFHPIG